MDDLLRRYQLALSLVDDPDVAGDLFMASRSLVDLRRRINRWRKGQGLKPVTEPVELAPLTEAEKQHALHLAQRGVRQRRLVGRLATLATLVILAGGGYMSYMTLQPRLDSDPVFAGLPAWESARWRDLKLRVYKAEVQVAPLDDHLKSFTITVWWEVTGPTAADAYRLFSPQLLTEVLRNQDVGADWVDAASTQRFSVRPDRVLGLSRFQTQGASLNWESALRLHTGLLNEPEFMAPLQLWQS